MASLFAYLMPPSERYGAFPVIEDEQPVMAAVRDNGASDVPYKLVSLLPTGSMEPTLTAEDLIVVHDTPYSDLKEGMVVSYTPEWAVKNLGVGGYGTVNGAGRAFKIIGEDGDNWLIESDGKKAPVSKSVVKPPVIMHRLVMKDKHGWIASGDNNKKSEASERITEKNYKGQAVKAYRKPKAKK